MATPVKYFLLAVILVLLGLAARTQIVAAAEDCSGGLSRLTVCAPYVVPGADNGPPNDACCSALRTVDHSCLCSTISIINRLPSTCKLPQVTCSHA